MMAALACVFGILVFGFGPFVLLLAMRRKDAIKARALPPSVKESEEALLARIDRVLAPRVGSPVVAQLPSAPLPEKPPSALLNLLSMADVAIAAHREEMMRSAAAIAKHREWMTANAKEAAEEAARREPRSTARRNRRKQGLTE